MVSTVNTLELPGISLRQSPTLTSVADTVPLPTISKTTTTAAAPSTHSPESTNPAIARPRPPWPYLARFSPTMPKMTLSRTIPITPVISETTAHQLVFGAGGGG